MAFLAWRTAMGPLSRDGRRDLERLGPRLARRHQVVDEPDRLRLVRASTRRPVKIISLASGAPRMRGRSWVPPMPGKMPRVDLGHREHRGLARHDEVGEDGQLAAAAHARSPRPRRSPAPGSAARARRACSKITCWARQASSVMPSRSLRSPPTQKALVAGAGEDHRARRRGPTRSASKQRSRSSPIAVFMAFSGSGRLSSTVTT